LKSCGVPQLFRPEAGFGHESGSHAGKQGRYRFRPENWWCPCFQLPQPLPYLSRQKDLWNYAPMLSPM
jgi:hypothetical protein